MHVKPKDITQLTTMWWYIEKRVEESRFTVGRIEPGEKKDLVLRTIRLKKKADYCGQHAGPCVAVFFERKHRRTSYLQGADWVGWNRLLNDLFDERGWEADIWSTSFEFLGKMRIRRGRLRRMLYRSYAVGELGHQAWDAPGCDEDFADWVGKTAPAEQYPEDTPGVPCWKRTPE